MSKLNELTIRRAAEGLRAKEFSCKELLDDCLVAIGGKDGDINAFITVDEDGANLAAGIVDKKLAKGDD